MYGTTDKYTVHCGGVGTPILLTKDALGTIYM